MNNNLICLRYVPLLVFSIVSSTALAAPSPGIPFGYKQPGTYDTNGYSASIIAGPRDGKGHCGTNTWTVTSKAKKFDGPSSTDTDTEAARRAHYAAFLQLRAQLKDSWCSDSAHPTCTKAVPDEEADFECTDSASVDADGRWVTACTAKFECKNEKLSACTDPAATNYDEDGTDDSVPSVCTYDYPGCKDSTAANYDENATIDSPDACMYGACKDPYASNYEPNAPYEDSSTCQYIGCTDSGADNYNSHMVSDTSPSSCVFTGCMDSSADNYDARNTADTTPSSCNYTGCMDSSATNYDARNTSDTIPSSCNYLGCTDSTASNYDPRNTSDTTPSSCSYTGCMNSLADNYDSRNTSDTTPSSCIFTGCMDPGATNYESSANNACSSCCTY